ncbi:ABC transporter permease [Jiangella ureilytica]|uniref:ABC transporter permease n=1 Tax=Jiangella ureilytica TaxID=2530374 RepID=A0A4R4RV19_9ACTN|nr:ABC transporter permease [Jiangella ureilytica]TDC53967.1 ABC transporter permease [Jiangella ureilytica]
MTAQSTLVSGFEADPPGRGFPPASRLRGPVAHWSALIVLLAMIVLLALPAIWTTSPTALDPSNALSPPSLDHPFGTDQVGRDIAARVLHGARLSALVAVASTLIALVAGGILGAAAATGPRWLSEIIMRVVDVGLAFPGILLAIVLAAAIGPHLSTTIIVLGVLFTPPMARVMRALVFKEYGEDYVLAARLTGTSRRRLVIFHISRNIALPVTVFITITMAEAIVAEAALSFIGAGIRPPAPSWGNIIRDGYTMISTGAWWISLFPGFAVLAAVFGLNRYSEMIGKHVRMR